MHPVPQARVLDIEPGQLGELTSHVLDEGRRGLQLKKARRVVREGLVAIQPIYKQKKKLGARCDAPFAKTNRQNGCQEKKPGLTRHQKRCSK